MNRQRILMVAVALLALVVTGRWIISGWGLITVHADGRPLSEIIRSIEKQGGITIRTNMDVAAPTTMHVDKVPLGEAMEVLSAVTDSRYRLAYVFAQDPAAVETGLAAWTSGLRPDGWKVIEVPLMGRGSSGVDAAPLDPRRDVWKVESVSENTLHAFMENAAVHVSAAFACPEAFNPAISKAPSSGEIRKAAAALADAANAKMKEVFLLQGRPPGAPEGDDEEGPPRIAGGEGGGRPNFDLMRQRRLNEIAKLPASQQSAAKAEQEEMDKVFAEVRDLPREDRRAKMQEIMSRPELMDRMEDRRLARDELRTPEQRIKRYKKYVSRKQEAKQ
jgi:hypothetical protein